MQDLPQKTDEDSTDDVQIPIDVEPDVVPDEKKFLAKFFASILVFLKKYKWVIIGVVALVVFSVVALYNFIAIITINNTKLVNLDSSVRIEMGQIVKTKAQNVSVKVTNFVNDKCPEGAKCFGDGSKSVEYMVTVDGQGYATGSVSSEPVAGYKIETVDSDYSTYADIKIVK